MSETIDIMEEQSLEDILNKLTGGEMNKATTKEILGAVLIKMTSVDGNITELKKNLADHNERVQRIENKILEKQNEIVGAKFAMGLGWKIVIGIALFLGFVGTILENEIMMLIGKVFE